MCGNSSKRSKWPLLPVPSLSVTDCVCFTRLSILCSVKRLWLDSREEFACFALSCLLKCGLSGSLCREKRCFPLWWNWACHLGKQRRTRGKHESLQFRKPGNPRRGVGRQDSQLTICHFLEGAVKGFLLLRKRLNVTILRLRLKEKPHVTVIKR